MTDLRADPGHPFVGARILDGRLCEFRVWAPSQQKVELKIVSPPGFSVSMERSADGYHSAVVDDCAEGTRYLFVLENGNARPDPASRHQPEGVHAPSAVVASSFEWHDRDWKGVELEDLVVYELHVGTFTAEGTFDAVIGHLDELEELGITAIELLPVGQFPGARNWGYDGTYVCAAQSSYGGPRALKRLVDACHQRGLAILLDVVYNHLGPEGNYLAEFGPYFTDRYRTPWGQALNFDGEHSDDVRHLFIQSALQWVDEFHFDGLRVDAVHAIVDHSAEPFLQDLNRAVHDRGRTLGRTVLSIAESNLNDPRVITPPEDLGLGFDAQWSDDYHHVLHRLLTGESDGYYSGFEGRPEELARVLKTGFFYIGQHSPYFRRKYGARPKTTNGAQFVISAQNHDQVGNRMLGERLATLLPYERLRLVAAAILLSPFIPMLFMGEEYGEKSPFQYFTSHSDPDLIEAVRRGRQEEFDDFKWAGDPPDPHAEETFHRSRLDRSLLSIREHQSLRELHKDLLALRRSRRALRTLDLAAVDARADDERRTLIVQRSAGSDRALIAFNFGDVLQTIDCPFEGSWQPLVDGASLEAGRIELGPYSFGVWATA